MSDPVAIALIGLARDVGVLVPSVIAAWFAYRASVHAKDASESSKETATNTNGIKDNLVALTDKEAYARGKFDQKETESRE